jgi:WD40 repeat protein
VFISLLHQRRAAPRYTTPHHTTPPTTTLGNSHPHRCTPNPPHPTNPTIVGVHSDIDITKTKLQEVLYEETGSPITNDAIDNFFAKVDMDGGGRIEWTALASYLHLTLVEKEEATARSRLVDFHLPARTMASPHQESIVRCTVGTKGVIWSMGSDGVIASWPTHIASAKEFTPFTVTELELTGRRGGVEPGHRWTTDFALMPDMSKVAVATGERKIYFFNMGGDFLTQFIVSNLPGIPTKMAGGYSTELDASILVFGDSNGALGLLVFPKYYWQSPYFKGRVDKSRPPLQISAVDMLTETGVLDPEYNGVNLQMWHGHTEWVNEMLWEPSLGSFISCSSDPKASMIVGEPIGLIRVEPTVMLKTEGAAAATRPVHRAKHLRVNHKQAVFSVPKGGIRSVSFCKELGLLATGGTDREIRLWSPSMNNHSSSSLNGHEFGVVAVQFQHGGKGLASIDSHRTVRIWNIASLACVRVMTEQAHHISTELSYMIFAENINGLLLFPKHGIAYLELRKGKSPRPGCTHASSVRCTAFNERFNHVVTACEDGIVSMWALESGDKVFEFRGWKNDKSPLQSIVVTEGGTRLVTASENGETNLWQYSTGQHLCRFIEAGSMPSVTMVIYMVAAHIHNIVTVGWR